MHVLDSNDTASSDVPSLEGEIFENLLSPARIGLAVFEKR